VTRDPKRGTAPFFRARKRFGQNFLEPAWVDKVVAAIAPASADVFLEIGPGPGALTRPLAARAKRVVAFEIDRDLASDLTAGAPPNLVVETGDFLDITADRIRESLASTVDRRLTTADLGLATCDLRLRVAGNLPYNVASPIMFKLVELFATGLPIADATLMLQREVADRLTAVPGTRDYGILTVLIGHHARVERVLALPPGAFRPVPKVRSALVRLRFHPPAPPARNESLFSAMVQAVFTRRRKTLANALLAFSGAARLPPLQALAAAGLDGRRRPETLSIAELVRLSDAFVPESGRAVL
jgi:16S rRNA (adenine1518-N6/adenine1519-N6)-dimethyltransferase